MYFTCLVVFLIKLSVSDYIAWQSLCRAVRSMLAKAQEKLNVKCDQLLFSTVWSNFLFLEVSSHREFSVPLCPLHPCLFPIKYIWWCAPTPAIKAGVNRLIQYVHPLPLPVFIIWSWNAICDVYLNHKEKHNLLNLIVLKNTFLTYFFLERSVGDTSGGLYWGLIWSPA